jgi:hypothetical protein
MVTQDTQPPSPTLKMGTSFFGGKYSMGGQPLAGEGTFSHRENPYVDATSTNLGTSLSYESFHPYYYYPI